ncbi:MAG: hypothetical protein AB3X44_02135 [Leptothrix sp. (in: b-proteobacteria)]
MRIKSPPPHLRVRLAGRVIWLVGSALASCGAAQAEPVRAAGGALVTIPRAMDAEPEAVSAASAAAAMGRAALKTSAGGSLPRSESLDWPPAVQEVSGNGCAKAITGKGQTYNVGPGQKYSELTELPWLSLGAGDVVNIFHRPEPYRTKIGLRGQGHLDAPIVINGVTDASCNRPVISGENAVTARDAAARQFFSKKYSEMLGVFLLYKSPDDPWGYRPKHLRFQNLKITGANKDNTYTGQDGMLARYDGAAAAIYAVVVEDLTVENCEITRNGNGLFINSKEDDQASSRVTIRANRIWDNGNVGSWFEHNLYVQTARALYEGNYIGQLIPGAKGSSVKDRSSATVVRYNHIVAAARALDLVEIEGGVKSILNDPYYPHAWVYGNLIVNDWKQAGRTASVKMIHWGGDNDPRYFRQGTLNFYNNTVIINADRLDFWYVSLFDQPTDAQKVVLRANIIQSSGSADLRLGNDAGTIDLDDSNWISAGWSEGGIRSSVKLNRIGTVLEGKSAGLDKDHHPQKGSPVLDRGQLSAMRQPAGLQLDNLRVTHQYQTPARIVPRPITGTAADLGAFEMK